MRRHRKTSYGSGRVPVLPDTFLAGKKDHFRHQGVVAEDSSSDSGDESSLVSRSSFGPGLHRLRKTAQIVTASTGESRQLFEHITYLVDNVRTSRPDDLPKSIDAISGHCLSSGERRSIRDCGALRLLFTSPLLYVEDPSFDRRTVESLCKLLYLLSTERLVRGFIERSAKLLSFCSWALGRLNEESAAGERSEAARLPVGDSVSDSVGSPTTSAPPSPFVSVAVVTPAPLPLPSSKPAKSSDPTMSGRKRKRGGKRGRGQDRERERERGQKRNDENVDEVSSCSNDISTPTGCCSDVSAVVVGRGVGRGGVRQTSSLRLESTLSNMSTLPSPTGSDLVLLMLRRIVAGVVGMDGLDDGEVGRGGNDVEEVLKVVETSGCLKGVTRCLINMMKMIRSNGSGSGSGSGSGNGDGDGDGNGDDNGNGYASSDDTRRLTMLLNIIDGSCCLCPNNQKVLCGYDGGSLVPSLVDFVSERCATSDDLTLVACQLLTSITHENPVASLHMITAASTTTTTTYLKKIIMALGEKEKRRKSIQSEKGDDNDDAKGGSQPAAAATATSSVLPVLFDEEIYLLNMLTNAIEAEPKAVTGKVGARDIEVFKSILEVRGMGESGGVGSLFMKRILLALKRRHSHALTYTPLSHSLTLSLSLSLLHTHHSFSRIFPSFLPGIRLIH